MGNKVLYLNDLRVDLTTVPGCGTIRVALEGHEPLGYDPDTGTLFQFGDPDRAPVASPLSEFQTRSLLRLLDEHNRSRRMLDGHALAKSIYYQRTREGGWQSSVKLFDNGDFNYVAELVPLAEPVGGFDLFIKSTRRSVKHHQLAHVRLHAWLDHDAVRALQCLFEGALPPPRQQHEACVESLEGHRVR